MNNNNIFSKNGLWYFNAKKVDLSHFETLYHVEGGFDSKESAESAYTQCLQEYKRDIEFIKKQTNIRFTFTEFLDYWYHNCCEKYSFSGSYKGKMAWTIYTLILPNLTKDVLLGQVDCNYIEKILSSSKQLCRSAEQAVYSTLLQVFKFAKDGEYITLNPMRSVKTPANNIKRVAIMRKDQIRQFLIETQKNPYTYLETLLGLFCGLRSGETRGLKYSDFDLKEKTVTISRQRISDTQIKLLGNGKLSAERKNHYFGPPKTLNSYRTLPVHDYIIEELKKRKRLNKKTLKEHPTHSKEYKDYVSISAAGNITNENTLLVNVKNAAKNAGITFNVNYHLLRHTFCTILIEQGVPVKEVSKIMGHSRVQTTMEIYCGVMEADNSIRETIETLDPINHIGKAV